MSGTDARNVRRLRPDAGVGQREFVPTSLRAARLPMMPNLHLRRVDQHLRADKAVLKAFPDRALTMEAFVAQ
jgi:hypothetical protein